MEDNSISYSSSVNKWKPFCCTNHSHFFILSLWPDFHPVMLLTLLILSVLILSIKRILAWTTVDTWGFLIIYVVLLHTSRFLTLLITRFLVPTFFLGVAACTFFHTCLSTMLYPSDGISLHPSTLPYLYSSFSTGQCILNVSLYSHTTHEPADKSAFSEHDVFSHKNHSCQYQIMS